MTKVTIIGEEIKAVKKYTHIKFLQVLTGAYTVNYTSDGGWCEPNEWNHIELICKNYSNGKDLMFAYDEADYRNDGVLYIGYFNEGTVA